MVTIFLLLSKLLYLELLWASSSMLFLLSFTFKFLILLSSLLSSMTSIHCILSTEFANIITNKYFLGVTFI